MELEKEILEKIKILSIKELQKLLEEKNRLLIQKREE